MCATILPFSAYSFSFSDFVVDVIAELFLPYLWVISGKHLSVKLHIFFPVYLRNGVSAALSGGFFVSVAVLRPAHSL